MGRLRAYAWSPWTTRIVPALGGRALDLTLPTRFLIFVVLLYPYWTLILLVHEVESQRLRKRRLRRIGICHKCSYDLRGNVSGVYPECGSPILRDRDSDTAE